MTGQDRPCNIGILSARDPIGILLEEFVRSAGWTPRRIAPGYATAGAHALSTCRLLLCDLDLPAHRVAAARSAGPPVIYFSGCRRTDEIDPPDDGPFFSLPPDWAELAGLIRARL